MLTSPNYKPSATPDCPFNSTGTKHCLVHITQAKGAIAMDLTIGKHGSATIVGFIQPTKEMPLKCWTLMNRELASLGTTGPPLQKATTYFQDQDM